MGASPGLTIPTASDGPWPGASLKWDRQGCKEPGAKDLGDA